jgi:single-stranded DNA-specific DHH superfamily exonuclease
VKALKNLEELFKIGIDFIKKIEERERVVLIYDTDVDGIVSAVLFLSAIEKMGKEIKKSISIGFGEVKKMKKRLKEFDVILTVDVPIDLIDKYLVSLGKRMLIIDHHPGRDLNSERIVLVNPRLENPEIYQPTSYVVYKMFKDVIKEKRWVAVLGTVGDMGIDDCKDLVRIRNKKNVWKSKSGKAAMLLTASIAVFGPEKTLKILANSKSLEDIVKNNKIILASKKFDKELERCEKEFRKNLEVHGKILISKIKPRYRAVCSALITRLATEAPEKMIFIFEDKGKTMRIHGRNSNGEVNVGGLFSMLGIGGGHREAGAGTINKRDEKKFKIRILSKLKDFSR